MEPVIVFPLVAFFNWLFSREAEVEESGVQRDQSTVAILD